MIHAERWRTLAPLLDDLLDLSEAERVEYLTRLRAENPNIAEELTGLLAAESVADDRQFLASPLAVTTSPGSVGEYVLERPIGEGATSSVWSAHHREAPGERVAVKLLDLRRMGSVVEERFRREGALLRRLSHPGIAGLIDAGVSADGQHFLILEYVAGRPIDEYGRARLATSRERVMLVRQLLAAVAYAHANQVVHRDIKPSNVLVTDDGVVKVLDFGISKALDVEGRAYSTSLTARGGHVLTPDYAAPEQLRGDAVSAATDVYAIGVLLYLLLSGRHPTSQGVRNATEAFAAALSKEPAALGLGELDGIVACSLRKRPEDRYPNAATFGDALARWLTTSTR